jgi:hypothetical protein
MNKKHPMKTSIKIIIIFSIFYQNVSFAQVLKKYNGFFERGKAQYSYYEDTNYNRQYQGAFFYTDKATDVKGSFLHGKRNGKWLFTGVNKTFSNPGAKILINTNITGLFKNGLFDGLWTYSNRMNLFNVFNGKLDPEQDTETSTATFKNGIFTGKIVYSSSWPEAKNVTGEFDAEGKMFGTWKIETRTKKEIVKYLHGVAYWRMIQNSATGAKITFSDNTTFVKMFWDNYNETENVSIINGKSYSAKKVQMGKSMNESSAINMFTRNDPQNPAILLWTDDSVTLFQNQALRNPLFSPDVVGFKAPICYEVIIESI